MRVLCIGDINDWGQQMTIKKGQWYEAKITDSSTYYIESQVFSSPPNGLSNGLFSRCYFKSLQDLREEKLNELI